MILLKAAADNLEAFLPKKLVKMIQLLVDGKAVTSPEASFVTDETTQRWYIAISESILYCSRQNYASRVLPPLQNGLMLQLYHVWFRYADSSFTCTQFVYAI